MKVLSTALLLTATALVASALQEVPMQPIERSPQHEWLLQLVGEWEASAETVTESGGEPVVWKSTESVRTIGDLWIVAEGRMPDERQPFTSLMTIGYDIKKEAFVGSWVDSIQSNMWTYHGELDEDKRLLSLHAVGPSVSDPNKTAKYRDQLELVDADHKRMVSSMLGDDGEWQVFMTVDYRRKK